MAGCKQARFYLAECELPTRRAADRYEVQVTIHEGGRELGMGFTRMVTSRDEARPV